MEEDSAGSGYGTASCQVDRWLRFAMRQEARTVPHPHGGLCGLSPRGAAGTAAAYRLALSHVECLPLFQAEDRPLDVRLGLTLFDAAAGCFLGPTARSRAVQYDMRRSKGKQGFHIDLDCSFFMHTHSPLARTAAAPGPAAATTVTAASGGPAAAAGDTAAVQAVVEVVLIERGNDGLPCAEYSAGWCAIPLEQTTSCYGGRSSDGWAGSTAATPHGAVSIARAGCTPACSSPGPLSPLRCGALAGQRGAVPVLMGSPRLLLLQRTLPPGQCPAPPQLTADGAPCRLHYQFEMCPEMADTWVPLVPEDYLVSCWDVVPGLQRQLAPAGASLDHGGSAAPSTLTPAVPGTASCIDPPLLHSVQSMVLAGLSVRLPEGFLEVVRRQAAVLWRQVHGAAGLPPTRGLGDAGRLLPLAELRECLHLRVSVHNGRRFVGPPAVCPVAAVDPVEGCRGEHLLALSGDAPLAWVPADRCVALVAELVLRSAPAGLGSGGGGGGSDSSLPLETVLGWAAVAPFHWPHGGSGEAVVAEGAHEVKLRSGPGRWVRPAPVLDWRRLLERATRSSPCAPHLTFALLPAPSQAVWPPPAAPMRLLPSLPASTSAQYQHAPTAPAASMALRASEVRQQQLPAAQPGQLEQAQRATAASEADTLVSVQTASKAGRSGKGEAGGGQAAGKQPIAPHPTLHAWNIRAHYNALGEGTIPGSSSSLGSDLERAAAATGQQEQPVWDMPRLPRIRTTQATERHASPRPASKEEAEALYAGSPTKRSRQGGRGPASSSLTATEAALAAAAAALPSSQAAGRPASLQAELSDTLVSAAACMQPLGFEAAGGSAEQGEWQQPLPQRLHFTFRFFHSDEPTITSPLRLMPVQQASPGGCGSGSEHSTLFALLHNAAGESMYGISSAGADSTPPAPEVPLPLLDVAALERHTAELAAQGAPPAAAAGLARQHRLRVAGFLAERRLQVDVWDGDSLLQVGTLSVPLRPLLRQGAPAAEVVLRVPVMDHAQAVERVEGSGGSSGPGVCLTTAPLRGAFLLRLACWGAPLPAGVDAATSPGDAASWPASPMKRGKGQAAAVQLDAGSSLEAGPEAERSNDEAAGKRESILRRLQAELPSCVAVCVAPGEVAGLEREFVNSSGVEAWFTLDAGASTSCAGSPDSDAELSLVTDEQEWRALEPQAQQSGLTLHSSQPESGGSGTLRVITTARFRMAPHERCLLRFKLSRGLGEHEQVAHPASCSPGHRQQQGQQQQSVWQEDAQQERSISRRSRPSSKGSAHSSLGWHSVRILHAGGSPLVKGGPPVVAATFRLAVAQLPAPAVDRTLRLFCPAGVGTAAAAVHAVQLDELPGTGRLLTVGSELAFLSSTPQASARLHSGTLLLSCMAPPAGSCSRFLLIVHASNRTGRISSTGSHKGAGPPLETWEVFLNALPSVRLAAGVGEAATTSRSLPAQQSPGRARELTCYWRGCPDSELQAAVGSATAAGRGARNGSGRLALSFEPSGIDRRRLLLSVVCGQPAGVQSSSRWQQSELLLLDLDSTGTAVSRSFEVEVPAGQVVSKKVRYTSPHPQPRCFRVRLPGLGNSGGATGAAKPGQPQVMRISRPVFELGAGDSTAIKLTFDGSAAAGSRAAGQPLRHEVLAVLESAPAQGGSSGRALGAAGMDGAVVEEVFQIVVTIV